MDKDFFKDLEGKLGILGLGTDIDADDMESILGLVKLGYGIFVGSLEHIANDKKLWKAIAQMYKSLYDSLIEVGFTEEQAWRMMLEFKEGINQALKNTQFDKKK